MAAGSDPLFTKHVCHASLGDAVPIANPLSSFADLVSVHNVDDVFGGQKALRAGIWTVLGRSEWSCWRFGDAFAQVSPMFTEVTEVRVSSYSLHKRRSGPGLKSPGPPFAATNPVVLANI